MIVSYNRTNIRHHVKGIWLAGKPIWSVWNKGVQLYPDERNYVTAVAFAAKSATDADWNYWAHVLDKVREDAGQTHVAATVAGSTSSTSMAITAFAKAYPNINFNGQTSLTVKNGNTTTTYELNSKKTKVTITTVTTPTLTLSCTIGGKTYTHGKDGCEIDLLKGVVRFQKSSLVFAKDVKAGSTQITITASVPARNTPTKHIASPSTSSWNLPYLPKQSYYIQAKKYKKKVNFDGTYTVKGSTSGTQHIKFLVGKHGHHRGDYYETVGESSMSGSCGHSSYISKDNLAWKVGDTSLQVVYSEAKRNFGSSIVLQFPAFTKSFTFTVLNGSVF